MFSEDCTLIISTCDRYSSAWYPYFELLKQNWQEHPVNIVLNTETKTYTHDGLHITVMNGGKEATWSKRLYDCLAAVRTKYIIFSLEDFFIQAPVNHSQIESCYQRMEEDSRIAVFRLCASNSPLLTDDGRYQNFRLATAQVPYRLETQFALWNRETLMSYIDVSESPWQFEGQGTKRILNTDKLFYWYYLENIQTISKNMIVPYLIGHEAGYGINWGKWLWKNEGLFEKYGIRVDFSALGVLSERAVKFRLATLYNPSPTGVGRLLKHIMKYWLKLTHLLLVLRRDGVKKAMELFK